MGYTGPKSVHILIVNSTKGHDLDKIGQGFDGEDEILYERGSSFEVVDAKEKQAGLILILKEV